MPCSLLKGLVSLLEKDHEARYVSATREDSALGMAAGAFFGGKRPMVLMQNSGLGVSVNALASLHTLYEIPVLLVISWRGEDRSDAPEHWMMGEIMSPVLDLMKIPHRVLSPTEPHGRAGGVGQGAARRDAEARRPDRARRRARMNKLEAIKALTGRLSPEDLVVCCNGMIGRELYTVGDRPASFYMIGSMGLGLSIALGLALARPSRRVIALDGDGNVLMGMNALASAGSERPPNLYHVVLDNQAHASTGGQRTISGDVRLEAVASAVGYRATHRAETLDHFDAALRDALGPSRAGDGARRRRGRDDQGDRPGQGDARPS